jgi:hypothetical protein
MAEQPIYFSTSPIQFLHPSLLEKVETIKIIEEKHKSEQEKQC